MALIEELYVELTERFSEKRILESPRSHASGTRKRSIGLAMTVLIFASV